MVVVGEEETNFRVDSHLAQGDSCRSIDEKKGERVLSWIKRDGKNMWN
jgi:hypothetical protein